MYYFCTIAIIPGDTFRNEHEVKEAVNDLLVPYWKHLEDSCNRQYCRCIGSLSIKESDEYLKEFFKLDEVRGCIEYFGIEPEVRPNNIPVLEFMAKRRLAYFNEYCPFRYKPDPQCPICGGTGYDITYHNPNTKWDAYAIGGRFDGKIWGPERFEEKQEVRISAKYMIEDFSDNEGNTIEEFLPDFRDCCIEDNCRIISEIPFDDVCYVPYALVTPDGAWHEECDYISPGKGYGPDVDEKWLALLKTEYAKYPTHLAVMLHCQR